MNLKIIGFVLVSFTFLWTALPSYAKSEVFTSGEDWESKMSDREKFISLYAPMIIFHRYGVPFSKSPEEYITEVSQVLHTNPQLKKEDITNILASSVYLYEPQSRMALDIMETEFLRGNMHYNRFSPRLLIPLSEAKEDADETP